MKKYSLILCALIGLANADTFMPNSPNFTCPEGEKIDLTRPILVGIGDRPYGIGQCYWENPQNSFSTNNDETGIKGLTTWTLQGGWLADGCSDIKGETLTRPGVISKVSCKPLQTND